MKKYPFSWKRCIKLLANTIFKEFPNKYKEYENFDSLRFRMSTANRGLSWSTACIVGCHLWVCILGCHLWVCVGA